ncbi:MAG: alpha/beta fold hydrolase [Deltaproteobacteria bacterium]|nr:alpha/beta fold hydrolase [Deltaproteobacteria bacterium]
MKRWMGRGVLALVVGLPAMLFLGAQLSLDRGFEHAARTQALPLLSPETVDGLVRVQARNVEFRTRVAGLGNQGPALLLLHGFPQTSILWEPLLEAAAAAGFRVAAFDQRGYSPGARPEGAEAYVISELRRDVIAVADALGFERFHLVGHDWGSIVTWATGPAHPDRVISLTSLSIPHPRVGLMGSNDPSRSPPLYVRLFQVPGLAETLFTTGRLGLLRRMYGSTPPLHINEYVSVFSEPGAMTAALNWYRALPTSFADPTTFEGAVSMPTLWIWGKQDMQIFHTPEIQARMDEITTGPYRSIELDAAHWLMQEQTDAVVEAILEHVASHSGK